MGRGKVILMTGGYDHTIRFWEVHSGMCCKTIQYPDSPINLMRVSPDKRWLAVAGNPHIRMFKTDLTVQGHTHSFEGHVGNVTSMAFDPTSQSTVLWSGGEDKVIKMWDVRAQPFCQKDLKCKHPVNSVALHPHKPVLLSGDQGGSIRLWDVRMGRCMRELLPEADNAIRWLSFAPNGRFLAAVNNQGSCFIWKIDAGGDVRFEGGGAPQAFTADEGSGENEEMTEGGRGGGGGGGAGGPEADVVLDMQPHKQLQAHKSYVLKCLFSPDSRLLATCSSDQTVKIWSVPSFKQEHTFTGHSKWVWDCEFSSDSNFLVTGSSDSTARSWNLAIGDAIVNFNGHHKAIISVALCDTSSAQT